MYGVPDFYQNDNVKKGTGMQWRHQVVSDLPNSSLVPVPVPLPDEHSVKNNNSRGWCTRKCFAKFEVFPPAAWTNVCKQIEHSTALSRLTKCLQIGEIRFAILPSLSTSESRGNVRECRFATRYLFSLTLKTSVIIWTNSTRFKQNN